MNEIETLIEAMVGLALKGSRYARVASILRQLGAVASVVIGALPEIHLPSAVHATLIAIGGAILAAEHVVATRAVATGPVSSTKPVPPPATPVTTSRVPS